jgi:pimeloyl-ACP methyl ester carboxylesterase
MDVADATVLAAPIQGDFDAIADHHAQILEAGTVLVGHSMGSYLALAIALRVPEKLDGLVLISTNAAADSEAAAVMRAKVSNWAAKAGMEALGDSLADTMLAPSRRQDEALRAHLRKMCVSYGLDAFQAHQNALAGRPDQTGRLGEIACPALVLTGSDDLVTPPDAGRATAEGLRHGAFAMLDGVGHMPPLECPEDLAARIRVFLTALDEECAA